MKYMSQNLTSYSSSTLYVPKTVVTMLIEMKDARSTTNHQWHSIRYTLSSSQVSNHTQTCSTLASEICIHRTGHNDCREVESECTSQMIHGQAPRLSVVRLLQ